MANLTGRDRIIKAKIELAKRKPFFSFLATYLKIIEDSNIPTMAVDLQANLYFNAQWVDSIPQSQVMNVLCHEIMHNVLQHLNRGKQSDNKRFNVAADIKVNNLLVQEGMGDLPKGGLVPDRGQSITLDSGTEVTDIGTKTVEAIYKVVTDDDADKHTGNGDQFDQHNQSSTPDPKAQKKWKQKVAAASQASKGKMSAGLKRLVNDLLEPKIPWTHVLHQIVQAVIPHDYTYSRPHKKSHAVGCYMPSIKKENIDIVMAYDLSGSISKEVLQQYITEGYGIMNAYESVNAWLIGGDSELTFDTMITSMGNVSADQVLRSTDFLGGGGTSHRFVMDWVNEHHPSAPLVICFTDGQSNIDRVWKTSHSFKTIFVAIEGDYNNLSAMERNGTLIMSSIGGA